MKKVYVFAFLLLTALISLHYSSGPASAVGQGFTGAPGEGGTLCGNCHSGGPYGMATALLSITDNMGTEISSYVAGETYQISLTAVPGSGVPAGYGFQLTVLDGNDVDVASFSNPSANTKISTAANVAGGRTYAEHNGTSATDEFVFEWTAPAGGTGDVTFYYNVNLVDGTGGLSGDNGGLGFSMGITEFNPLVKVIGSLEINNAFTFPNVDGTANQVLTTDGSGMVSWMDAPGSLQSGSTSTSFLRANGTKENVLQRKELDALKNEVSVLKSEIEALKKLILELSDE